MLRLLRSLVMQEPFQFHQQLLRLPGFALPHDQAPSNPFGAAFLETLVPLDVSVELPIPETFVRCRPLRPRASLVPMPEAPVHKYDLAVPRQYDIRVPRQIAPVNPKSIPHPMNERPNQDFRLCVASFDATHDPATLLRGKIHRSSQRLLIVSSKYTTSATRAARPGGTALPICRAISIFDPVKTNSSGNDCKRAASRWVIGRCCFGCK